MEKALLARPVWLFDLDGTLVDSSAGVVRAFHAAQAACGEPPTPPDRIRAAIGYPLTDTVARLSQVPFADFFPHFRDEAMASMHLDSHLLPGAAALLETLTGTARRLGLVTSKRRDNAERILSHLGVIQHFQALVGADSTPQPKPHPGPIRHALAALGARPDEALMVGDTCNDIGAAHAAGVPVVAVGGGVDSASELGAADLFVAGGVAALLGLVTDRSA